MGKISKLVIVLLFVLIGCTGAEETTGQSGPLGSQQNQNNAPNPPDSCPSASAQLALSQPVDPYGRPFSPQEMFRNQVNNTPLIVYATVQQAQSYESSTFFTDLTLDVNKTYKGTSPSSFTITILGGCVNSRCMETDIFSYRPAAGDSAVFFLQQQGNTFNVNTYMDIIKLDPGTQALADFETQLLQVLATPAPSPSSETKCVNTTPIPPNQNGNPNKTPAQQWVPDELLVQFNQPVFVVPGTPGTDRRAPVGVTQLQNISPNIQSIFSQYGVYQVNLQFDVDWVIASSKDKYPPAVWNNLVNDLQELRERYLLYLNDPTDLDSLKASLDQLSLVKKTSYNYYMNAS